MAGELGGRLRRHPDRNSMVMDPRAFAYGAKFVSPAYCA
jgi:hypothetical protein